MAKPLNRTRKNKIEKETISNPGIYVTGGEIVQSDWDAETSYNTLMSDFTKMRNGDSFTSTSIDILMYPLINANYAIYPGWVDENKPSEIAIQAADYVRWIFNYLEGGEYNYYKHRLLAIPYGFAMFEKIWIADKYEGKPTLALAKLAPIQPDTVHRFKYDEYMNFIELEMYKRMPERGEQLVKIPAEKLHVFSPFSEYGNIVGRSILRPSRLVWDIKQRVWKATARAASRGAGIPKITITPTNNEAKDTILQSKANQIGRTIGNSENCYVIDQEGVFKTELMGLQNQQDNMSIINQCNAEITYNTLSQFIISGIGASGSRAATESHKSPYLEALNAYIKLIEENDNNLIKEIIEHSYFFGRLDEREYPYRAIERPKDLSLTDMAQNYIQLVSSGGITPTAKDEMYIRSQFGLPEYAEEEIEENNGTTEEVPEEVKEEIQVQTTGEMPEEDIEEITEEIPEDELNKKKIKRLRIRLKKFDSNKYLDEVFQLESCLNTLNKSGDRSKAIINARLQEAIAKYIRDYQQFGEAELDQSIKQRLENELKTIFDSNFRAGVVDVETEIETAEKKTELAKTPITITGDKTKLEVNIDILWDSVNSSLKRDILTMTDQAIENAGGLEKYIETFYAEPQKTVQADVINSVLGGYTQGRNEEMKRNEAEKPELKRIYTIRAEKGIEATGGDLSSVCEVCFPFDGIVFSQAEAVDAGLNWEGDPVNPNCLGNVQGKNRCKCQWVPLVGA